MAKAEDASIDSILKSIRKAIIDKEQRKYFEQFLPEKSKNEPVLQQPEEEQDEIFELSKNMIVKREDIPYQLGVWSFDDVAKKIMKKYQTYFAKRAVKNDVAESNDNQDGRVRVKENYLA